MKFLLECPECGKTSPVRFLPVEGGLVAVCGACGRRQPVPVAELIEKAEAPALVVSPPSLEEPADGCACPKCGRTRGTGQESCPKCGLVFALWVEPTEPFAGHSELAAQWAALRDVPVADPGHDRFLEACFRAGALSDAARAYKTHHLCGQDQGAARIRQIQLLSQMQFTPSSPVQHKRYRFIVWGLIFLVLLAALYIWTITPEDLMR